MILKISNFINYKYALFVRTSLRKENLQIFNDTTSLGLYITPIILMLPQITFLISLSDKRLTMELTLWHPCIISLEWPPKKHNWKPSWMQNYFFLNTATNPQLICFSTISSRPYIQPILLDFLLSLSFLHHFSSFFHFWHRYLS